MKTSHRPCFLRPAAAACASLATALVHAQALAPAATASERVVITGNPLASTDLAQPSASLAGDALTLRRAGTLGETLDGLPGVAATWFGPNANRPAIRGLDGDRVRLLDNAGATVDASNLSFDHAVALDPLVVERVEVLRGPASLLYGGNATGGVVNTLDNRIPRTALDGLGGRAELRGGGATNERSASGLVEAGVGGLNWHADAFSRATDDLRVPRFTPVEDGVAGLPTRRVRNSAARAAGGALGASWADADGYLGAAADTYRNDYGVTVEPGVQIRMRRERLAVAGERHLGEHGFTDLSLRTSDTTYQHQEVEGDGAVGTTFSSRGQDLRLEARHAPLFGLWRGAIGLQAEAMRFSALGEEAFVPDTRTRSAAVFALEQMRLGALSLSAGARVERVSVGSEGDAPGADETRFGAASTRRFAPKSGSLSAVWTLADGWSTSAVLGSTERAPAYYELFANGVHVATAAYERGDPTLGVERGQHADLGLQWKSGANSIETHLFAMRFSRYLSLDASGSTIPVPDEQGGISEVPEYRFRAVPARLWGAEIEGRRRLREGAATLDLHASLDTVRGQNLGTGEPLPRLAPMRASLGLDAAHGPWRAGLGVRHAWAQRQVPSTDVATPGYTLLNLWASRAWAAGGLDGLLFFKLDNLTDTLATSANSIRTLRDLAPLPGRSLSAGARVRF
jgi:iron complex outermembrane receptor protein